MLVWLNQSFILSSCVEESLTFQYMLKKIIKRHLQNIPICSSLKRRKKKKEEERKGSEVNIWAKTILSFSVRDFVYCYVTVLSSVFCPPLPISRSLECDIFLNFLAVALSSHAI